MKRAYLVVLVLVLTVSLFARPATRSGVKPAPSPRITPDGWVRHHYLEDGIEHRVVHPETAARACDVCFPREVEW
jgi:hypothetical protein